jgi:hypothetical protein
MTVPITATGEAVATGTKPAGAERACARGPLAAGQQDGGTGAWESHATFDLFDLGRRAAAARDTRLGRRAGFVRARQLLSTGAWRGPRDATESYVEVADLSALGGAAVAQQAGATLLVGADALESHRAFRAAGCRSLWRLAFRSGESFLERAGRLEALRVVARQDDIALWGVMPTPEGEAEGLDTLRLVATLRLEFPQIAHVVLDVAALGPRLAQMALGFGGDELWAPIVSERALRLGGNANNPSMTRKEAAILIRGAGLVPCERTAPETYREEEQ